MRCHICDTTLSENEISWNKDHKDWNPCGTCQEVIDNVFEPLDDEAIQKQLEFEFMLVHGEPFEEPLEVLDEESS